MPDTSRRRTILEIPWRTIFKLMAAVALAWLWLQLYQMVLLVIVAVLLAVTLNPAVRWLEARGWSRTAGATVVSLALLTVVVGFFWMTWSSLAEQAHFMMDRFSGAEHELTAKLPAWMRDSIRPPDAGDVTSYLAPYAVRVAQSTITAAGVFVLGFILMIYLLIEGRDTVEWLLAFVPKQHRAKADRTVVECEQVIFAYAVGNAITSLIAFAFTWIVLMFLKVPAALLLAVMAGLSDFVPVIGFVVSSIPAIALALTVSLTTTILVAVAYVLYNTVESYIISPWAYGNRLKLSNVSIVLAFAIGAEIAGVVGALIALPIAAIYPSIERIWLREKVGEDTVREHRAIERRAG